MHEKVLKLYEKGRSIKPIEIHSTYLYVPSFMPFFIILYHFADLRNAEYLDRATAGSNKISYL